MGDIAVRGNSLTKRPGYAKGGHVNTRRENRLEELGRVDAEKAYSSKGKRNLRDEKKRIVRELKAGPQAPSRPTPKWKQPKGKFPPDKPKWKKMPWNPKEKPKWKAMEAYKKGGWIQSVNKSIKKRGTKGVCTGKKFGGPTCRPGTKRYALAKTFKKMAKNRKG